MSIVSTSSSPPLPLSHNIDLYNALDATMKADSNGLHVKRYILAKDIKKYESEVKIRTDVCHPDALILPQDKLNSKLSSLSTLKVLTSPQSNISFDSPKASFPSSKQYLQPPQLFDHKKNSLVFPKPDGQRPSFDVSKHNDSRIKSRMEDSSKERNIFLEKNNPIDRSFYKEFNIGPRVDQEGKLIQYTLVGNPNWYTKHLEKSGKLSNSQAPRDSMTKLDDDLLNKSKTTSSSFFHKSNIAPSLKPKPSTEKSFSMRPETTSSNMLKTQQITISKKKKKMDQTIEITKDDIIKEFDEIERRHEIQENAEKKIIENMSLDNRNHFTREERVLQTYEHHKGDWDKLIKNMALISDRQPETSCMLRGEDHRKKIEYFQAYDSLKTEDEKFGKRIWYLQLRKYPKEHNKNKEQIENSLNSILKTKTQESSDSKNAYFNTSFKSNVSKKIPCKQYDMKEEVEKTQIDIFSGFNTVVFKDENREIEVIRRIQDPQHFHLSNVPYAGSKKKGSQSFIETKIKDSHQKLKNKIVVLDNSIDNFMVVGQNKLKSEKEAVIANKNKIFTKTLDNFIADGVEADSNLQKGNKSPKQGAISEIIDEDYNMNELSRKGNLFFPQIVKTLQNARGVSQK